MALSILIGVAVGIVVGAFIPSVGRKIKSLFVKESQAAQSAILTGVHNAEADVKAKVEKL